LYAPVSEERKNPRIIMTLVRELAEERSAAGAFSATYKGGVAVENPTENPKSNLETKRTGRLGAKTSADDAESERTTAKERIGLRQCSRELTSEERAEDLADGTCTVPEKLP
jgi:hypothetical protein